jgi:acid phosphatase type 7
MFSFSRRAFLGTALAGLTASTIGKADKPTEKVVTGTHDATGPLTTVFLTWQRDPTTTMTVQWIGASGVNAASTVSYAPLKAAIWQTQATTIKPYPLTDFKVFRAELSSLAPGTDYQFRIGRESPTYRFRTMPAKASDTISFISGGDCGVNPHTVANNIQAARQDPLFALIGGDLAYDNGTSATTNLAFLRNYSKTMIGRDGRLIPMLACLGNHEVNGGYHQPRAKAPFFFALFDGLYRDTSYAALDFGDYLSLILMDTGHISPIEGEQTHWLQQTLQARKDHPHVFVANHVPAYPSFRPMHDEHGTGGTGEANRKHWVPLFENYRVPVVLEHHDHTFKRSKPLLDGLNNNNGVLYLGDGSWGQLRAPQAPEKLTHLSMTSGEYHLSLHRLQGEERFHLALDENGRVMDVCRTSQRRSGVVPVAS